MDITYLGSASFLLRGRDAALVTDPSQGGAVNANIVTLSSHSNDDPQPSVEGPSKVIHRPGEYEVSGVLIKGVRTRREGAEGGRTVAYLFTIDNVVLCHLGPLNRVLSSAEAGELSDAEVLFLPVGGPDTLSASAASEVVALLSPNLVIPMLYDDERSTTTASDNDGDGDTSAVVIPSLEAFLKEMSVREITPQNRLSVTPTNQPASAQVVILQPRPRS